MSTHWLSMINATGAFDNDLDGALPGEVERNSDGKMVGEAEGAFEGDADGASRRDVDVCATAGLCQPSPQTHGVRHAQARCDAITGEACTWRVRAPPNIDP